MVSRRTFLMGGAGLTAAAAVPAGMYVDWRGKSFVRPGYDPDFPDAPDGEDSWMNWSGIERSTPKSIAYPETEAAIQDLLSNTKTQIRMVGSGHSFTGLATTEGTLIDVSSISGLIAFDAVTGRARFGAGTRLFDMAAELDKIGRALPNLPDIDVQTLAGSFSTATHGTGNTLTALHDSIHAFRLITPDGTARTVTKDSDPDLFAAGKVSLGALGVITEYELNTIPAFNLHRRMVIEPIDPFLEKIHDLAGQHRNFEFYYSPSTRMAAWISHDLFEGEVQGREESEDDDTLHALKGLRDHLGWFPWLRREVAKAAFPKGVVEDMTDKSFALLATTRPTRFIEMEYHLPREKGVETLRKVIKKLDGKKTAFFPLEYRHIAPDDAWLSPFSAGPTSSIAIHAAADEAYDYFFSEFEPLYRVVGGRPHWGKLHSLGKADFLELYPKFGEFLDLRRSLDPDGRLLNPHLAKLFGEPFNG